MFVKTSHFKHFAPVFLSLALHDSYVIIVTVLCNFVNKILIARNF